jgi:acyl-CoA thioesterase-1
VLQLLSCALVLTLLAAGCNASPQTAPRPQESSQPAAAPDNREVILAFGDSLTSGHGVLASESYPAQLQKLLDSEGYSYRVVNLGVSGDTTSGGLSRIDAALAVKPQIVILELGANDGLRGLPVDETRRNLEEMILRFQEANTKVVLAGMTLPLNYGPDYIRAFEQMYKDLAEKHQTALIPFFLEGVAARPNLNLDDGIHPTGEGYEIVTRNVFEAIKPLLHSRN